LAWNLRKFAISPFFHPNAARLAERCLIARQMLLKAWALTDVLVTAARTI